MGLGMNADMLIRRLGGQNYAVTRSAGGGTFDQVKGDFIPGATSVVQVFGLVQPLTADDRVSIPEANDRTKERLVFFSKIPLQNLKAGSPEVAADVVSVNGVPYQVESVEHWPNHGRAIIVRVNTNAN